MSYSYGGWAPYVSVAERRRTAERLVAKLRKTGHALAPVSLAGRKIATSFWGRAWCDNLESYRDFEYRLERGRSYVRNGLVIDLQVAEGRISAMVSGSELYRVGITIKPTPAARWGAICADCAGGIDSLIELLQGKFSKHVMARLCVQETGLFPSPSEIRFTCSCPDHASMCKHVAAVLYGVGARLDEAPELLFRLRGVDETEMVAGIDSALPMAAGRARVLETDDVSALFGLDMAAVEVAAEAESPPVKAKRGGGVVKVRVAPRATMTPKQTLAKARAKADARLASQKPAGKGAVQPKATASLPAKSTEPAKPKVSVSGKGVAKSAGKRAGAPANVAAKRAGARAAKPKPVKWW